MQIRYVFSAEQQAPRARMAAALLPVLAEYTPLKAELSSARHHAVNPVLYALMSKPLLQPQVQIFHADPASFHYHPLQWNILLDPPLEADLPACDEIWAFSAAAVHHWQSRFPELPVELMPVCVSPESLQTQAEVPVELDAPLVLFASLEVQDTPRLTHLLKSYIQAFQGRSDLCLALHLEADSDSDAEDTLLTLLLALCDELGCEAESLNLSTWIGPLEAGAYLAMLNRAQVLLAPSEPLQALEALALGRQVVGFELQNLRLQSKWGAEELQQALEQAAASQAPSADWLAAFSPTTTALAMVQRLNWLAEHIDFAAREAAWQAEQAQARQGRKQKYSLFHSDYNEDEIKARRQWHLRYARFFEGCPGDVLDIGCGSGIFLELMRELGLPAYGLDPDPDMVAVCQDLGLEALAGDERRLSEFQPGALGGIHASHIIEHVDGERAIAMIEQARRVLRPGGLLVIRTPNWRNQAVRHEGFWLDITHIRPYPLPLLKQVLEDAGLVVEQAAFEEFGWQDTYISARQPGGSDVH